MTLNGYRLHPSRKNIRATISFGRGLTIEQIAIAMDLAPITIKTMLRHWELHIEYLPDQAHDLRLRYQMDQGIISPAEAKQRAKTEALQFWANNAAIIAGWERGVEDLREAYLSGNR